MVFLLFLFSLTAWGWNEHVEITRAILENIPDMQETVPFHTLETALGHPVKGFEAEYQILKGYKFPKKNAEEVNKQIPIKTILAVYSDEPDWGIDQNLFKADQYPELWKEDLKYVCKKEGIMSQGFRHMYFPGRWLWMQPLSSVQIPLRPIGEGPERFSKFYSLSQKLFEKGEKYWGYRFLAWSVHYLEDLFQPFHTRQLPTLSFLVVDWSRFFPKIDVALTAETIGYYHFSYETWLAQEFRYENSPLRLALKTDQKVDVGADPKAWILSEAVAYSGKYASTISKLVYQIFPEFDAHEGLRAEQVVGKEIWWQSIQENPGQSQLIAQTSFLFNKMSAMVRGVIESATRKSESPHLPK